MAEFRLRHEDEEREREREDGKNVWRPEWDES